MNESSTPPPASSIPERPAIKADPLDVNDAASLDRFTWREHDATKARACRLYAESARLHARGDALEAEIQLRHPTDPNWDHAAATRRLVALYEQTAREYEKTAESLEKRGAK